MCCGGEGDPTHVLPMVEGTENRSAETDIGPQIDAPNGCPACVNKEAAEWAAHLARINNCDSTYPAGPDRQICYVLSWAEYYSNVHACFKNQGCV